MNIIIFFSIGIIVGVLLYLHYTTPDPTPSPKSDPTPDPTPSPKSDPTPSPTPSPKSDPTPSPKSDPVQCNDNEELINNACQCKLGYEYSNNKCIPLTLALYGHYNNPILGIDLNEVPCIFDKTGFFYGTKNIKQIDVFDGCIDFRSMMCCDKNGMVYYIKQLKFDPNQLEWETFNVKEKSYCQIGYNYTRMVVTLSGNIFSNEKKIASLNLKNETVVAFSTTFSKETQIIFTSEGHVYISVDSGTTWTLDKTIFKLKNHQIKNSMNHNGKNFYLLSDMKLYILTIESGSVVYKQIFKDFEIMCFDVYGTEIVSFYGKSANSDKKILCLNNGMEFNTNHIILNDVPELVDIKQCTYGLFLATTSEVYKCNFSIV